MKDSLLRKFWRQVKYCGARLYITKFPFFSGFIIFCFIVTALLGDILAPHSATEPNLAAKFIPPFFQPGGTLVHLLGTDMLGRDMLSRIIIGARPSLIVALVVIMIGGLGGTALGIVSGFYGGKVDGILMRVADSTIAFPVILLAMLLAILLKPSLQNVVISISIIIWARYARVTRGEVLSLRESDFIAQARVAGASGARIMWRHIFPNIIPTMLVMLTLQIGTIILVESSLSFLGAGVPPPTPVWGSLIASGRNYLTTAWWIPFFPGIALMLVCLSFNMLGDWLREVLDPKLRQAA